MGLYDGLMNPENQGLIGLSAGLLQAGGPSRMPVGLGQALGGGLMAGMQQQQQAQQFQQQKQMFDMKMSDALREAMERKKKEDAMAAFKLAHPELAGIVDLAPQVAIDRAFPQPKKPEPFKLRPGETQYGPDGQPIVSLPDKPAPRSSLAQLLAERDALPPDHPNRALYEDAIKKASMSQPVVTVDNRQDSAFGKEVGTEFGRQYSELMKADMNAPASIAKYDRLGSLLSQVNTGKFKGTTTDLKAAAKSLGVDLSAMGITDDVAPAQAARALSYQLALEMRNPSGGAGMPGAMSDKDREFLVQMIPSLENDPGSISKMIEYRQRLARREQQVAKLARAYRKKNNTFDDGFYDELQAWSDKNPLFPEAKAEVKPASTKVIDFGSLK